MRTLFCMQTEYSRHQRRTSVTASPPLVVVAQRALEDWRQIVRAARPRDLERTLVDTGFRPFRSGEAGPGAASGAAPDGALATADRCLAELVADAAHDPVAARIVLQRILPGLVSIARRRGGSRPAVAVRIYQDLLANAWIVIRCYPIERRPKYVAANLLRDVEYRTIVRESRRRRHRTEPWRDHHDEDAAGLGAFWRYATPSAPFDEVISVLQEARDAGARPATLRIAAAVASGRDLADLAVEDGLTVRAERYRRARAVAELRSLLVETGDSDGTPA